MNLESKESVIFTRNICIKHSLGWNSIANSCQRHGDPRKLWEEYQKAKGALDSTGLEALKSLNQHELAGQVFGSGDVQTDCDAIKEQLKQACLQRAISSKNAETVVYHSSSSFMLILRHGTAKSRVEGDASKRKNASAAKVHVLSSCRCSCAVSRFLVF